MARGQYSDVVLDSVGNPIAGATVTVKNISAAGAQTGNAAVYGSEAGSAIANPLLTAIDGFFSFWADTGARYDIVIAALGLTTRTVRWDNAFFPPAIRSIGVQHLGVDVLPLGTVLDWWRPSAAIPLPTGWVEARGQSLAPTDHDFPGGGTITLPDCRNTVKLGADSAVADHQVATPVNGAAGAPGVGAQGGSNVPRNVKHTHSLSAHTHTGAPHTHTWPAVAGLSTGPADTDPNGYMEVSAGTAGNSGIFLSKRIHHNNLNQSETAPTTPGTSSTPSYDLTGLDGPPDVDVRPSYTATIVIIKVKNT